MDAYLSFRLRDYRYLLCGAFLSNFGLQMLSLAVSWDLYLQTRSALVLGNVGFGQVAPFISGAPRGALLPRIVPIESLGNAITWNSRGQEMASKIDFVCSDMRKRCLTVIREKCSEALRVRNAHT